MATIGRVARPLECHQPRQSTGSRIALPNGLSCVGWSPRDHKPSACCTVAAASRGRRRRWGYATELSIRQAKARFAEAAAAARGERVVVTKHGRPFVDLIPVQRVFGMDFEKAAMIRRELGLDGLEVSLPPDFHDPAFSRQVLGLET